MIRWVRNQKGMPEGFDKICDKAVIGGFTSVFPVILCSATFHLIAVLLSLKKGNVFVYQAYYTFVVLALAEELCKFFTMHRIVRKGNYSWLAVIIIMTLVGLGFEVMEAIPYAVGAGPGPMFMRGFTLMHAAFGIIMGYFYGKYLKTGKKYLAVIGFVVPWIIHGSYDFYLSEPMMNLDWPGYLALLLAFLSAVMVILFIRFVIKAKNKAVFTDVMQTEKVKVKAEA